MTRAAVDPASRVNLASRRVWRVIGAIATVLAIVIVAAAQWSWLGRQHVEEGDLYYHAINRFEIDMQTAGSLTIEPPDPGARPDRIDIVRKLNWSGQKPEVTEEWFGETLRVTIRCREFLPHVGPGCTVDYALRIPTSVAITANVRGDIRLPGTSGDLDLSTTYGNIDMNSAAGRVSVKTHSGNVYGNYLRSSDVEADLGEGVVVISFLRAPASVTTKATSGRTFIEVPETGRYRIDAKTVSGERFSPIPPDPNSSNLISAISTSGSITITYTSDMNLADPSGR